MNFNVEFLVIEIVMCIRILVATLLGGAIGFERQKRKGDMSILRTHVFICVGAALVSAVGQYIGMFSPSGDVTRMAAQVISGIGFLGMGVIFKNNHSITGLTTASTIWIVGCIGIGIGLGAYILSVFATIVILFVLFIAKDSSDKAENLEKYDNINTIDDTTLN